jgi:coniferyl-aldehyde dehydrogenase
MNRDAMPTQPSLPRPTPPPAASYANTPYTPAGAAPGSARPAPCYSTTMESIFHQMRAASRQDQNPDYSQRRRRLDALHRLLMENRKALTDAVAQDFGQRSAEETQLLELFTCQQSVRHARRHLRKWMRPERRGISIWFRPARAEVRPQPLGCVGIVAPWNYPILLTVAPLVAALAAGNRAMVKMSELAPATAQLFAELVGRYFGADEVSIVEGGAETAQAFVRLPFDHLLYTGSTRVARLVLRETAELLTPVTLELGGKSPVIVTPGFPMAKAAERVMIGKCFNAGQTCVAPDYVLVPEGMEEGFAAACRAAVEASYPRININLDYTAIIDDAHFQRLIDCVADAKSKGATIVPLADKAVTDPSRRIFPPVALLGCNTSMRVMREEIFGPILPILPYRELGDALAQINSRERPLALYLFDTDRQRIDHVLDQTVSGGVTINDTLFHAAQDNLPFGGVGASGTGQYHGREGFLTFSKLKPVFRQSRFNGAGLLQPPYGIRFKQMLRFLMR